MLLDDAPQRYPSDANHFIDFLIGNERHGLRDNFVAQHAPMHFVDVRFQCIAILKRFLAQIAIENRCRGLLLVAENRRFKRLKKRHLESTLSKSLPNSRCHCENVHRFARYRCFVALQYCSQFC
jgi:hypothetical protein